MTLTRRITSISQVGDTPADTIMGQAANLGLTVGVLTGVGDNQDLSDADLIVPEVGDVIDLVTPTAKQLDMVRRDLTLILQSSLQFRRAKCPKT